MGYHVAILDNGIDARNSCSIDNDIASLYCVFLKYVSLGIAVE